MFQNRTNGIAAHATTRPKAMPSVLRVENGCNYTQQYVCAMAGLGVLNTFGFFIYIGVAGQVATGRA